MKPNIQRTNFDIVGSYGAERIPNINPERTVNMFEFIDQKAKKPKMLLPTSGILQKVNLNVSNGGFRSGFVFEDKAYFVVKNTIYQIDSAFVANPLGTIGTDIGYVGVDANDHQLVWVDGDKGYIFDAVANTFTVIAAAGFPVKPIDITFLDGFFIVANGDTRQFNLSAPYDGTIWDPLDFASLNTHPGTITGVKTLHRRLFVFSQFFTEVWENAGQADFPLRRNNSLLMEYGTTSIGSVYVNFDILMFFAQSRDGVGSIMKVTGTQSIPVSTQALDYQLQTYDNPQDCRAILYKENGLIFYRLNFTQDNHTWVYNVTQSSPEHQMWHEEEMLDGSRHVAQIHIFFQEDNYFGSYKNGILYSVSQNYLDNNGEAIKRLRITSPFISGTYNYKLIHRLMIDAQHGFSSPNPPNFEPIIYMFISRDDGNTYGNGLRASMGKIGEYLKRTIWRKLGIARNFIFRIEFYEQIRFVILGAEIDYEVLAQ